MKLVKEDDFKKLNLRNGKITGVKLHPQDSEIYVLLVDLGIAERDMQIVVKLKDYKEDELIGKKIVFLENIKPKKIKGIESQGKILMTLNPEGKKVFVQAEQDVRPGARIIWI